MGSLGGSGRRVLAAGLNSTSCRLFTDSEAQLLLCKVGILAVVGFTEGLHGEELRAPSLGRKSPKAPRPICLPSPASPAAVAHRGLMFSSLRPLLGDAQEHSGFLAFWGAHGGAPGVGGRPHARPAGSTEWFSFGGRLLSVFSFLAPQGSGKWP